MQVHGVSLIDDGDRVVAGVLNKGEFEPESIAAWKAAMVRGMVAIDIGAYTGLYAIAAAQAGAVAVAYEPNPHAFRRLLQNIERNQVQVECRQQAVSGHPGRAAFWIKHDLTSAGRLKHRDNAKRIDVEVVVLAEPRRVCAIKADIEGAEFDALRACRPLLERDRPLVIAEALNDTARAELIGYMKAVGYRHRHADSRNLIFEVSR